MVFLGIEFTCKEGMIEMNQTKYIERVLARFNMQNCKPRSTPYKMNSSKVSEESSTPADRLYREIIGSLVYIMTATRPRSLLQCNKAFTAYISTNSKSHEHCKAHIKVSEGHS